jgi:protein gp37
MITEEAMAASEIEWTESTWNPIAGCTMVSPGCTNCYAMRLAARLEAMGAAKYQGTTRRSAGRRVWSGRLNVDGRALQAPLTWGRPQRVFVNSMSDLFHDQVPLRLLRKVWGVMARAHWHTFQILTKRPGRMSQVLTSGGFDVLPNVWLGTSVESSDYVWRLDDLRRTPGSIRFVSFEPLLGPVGTVDLTEIQWAIVGGESGPHARPMDQLWVDQIHRACREQRVAFFFKQWGGTRKKKTGRLLHGQTWDEYPPRIARASSRISGLRAA